MTAAFAPDQRNTGRLDPATEPESGATSRAGPRDTGGALDASSRTAAPTSPSGAVVDCPPCEPSHPRFVKTDPSRIAETNDAFIFNLPP
jgi:hypothetical protein